MRKLISRAYKALVYVVKYDRTTKTRERFRAGKRNLIKAQILNL